MPDTPVGIIVDPNGQTSAITITAASGNAVTAYTSNGGSSTHTFPVSISVPTEFWLVQQAQYTVAATGSAGANGEGGNVTVDLRGGGVQSIQLGVVGDGDPDEGRLERESRGAYRTLTHVAATVSANGAAVVSQHNPVDATGAARTITLPTGQTEGTEVSIEKVDSSTNAVSITGNIRGVAASTITLVWFHESLTFVADSAGSWWPVSGHKTKSALDATYQTTVVPHNNKALGGETRNKAAASYSLIGFGSTTQRMYFQDSGGGRIVYSEDGGTTLSSGKTLPTDVTYGNVAKIIYFAGKIYMFAKTTTDNLPTIFSATETSGSSALTWSAALFKTSTGSGASGARPTCFTSDGTYLYVADYGDPTPTACAWRSSDGTTWTQIVSDATVRHIHAIKPDPYNAGHVWMALGDGISNPIRRSTDYGSTWSNVPTQNGTVPQVTDFGFSSTTVWATDDTSFLDAVVIDRTTLVWKGATPGPFHQNIAVPNPPMGTGHYYDGVTNGTTTFVSASAVFSSADVGVLIRGVGIPAGAKISTFTNSTTVVLSAAATTTATGVPFSLQRPQPQFLPAIFYGECDPATGIFYYICQQDTTTGISGLFCLTQPGATPILLHAGTDLNPKPIYVANDRVYYGWYWRPRIF